MKKELEIKKQLLENFYNLSKKVDDLTNDNIITEFKKIFIDNLYKFNDGYTKKQRKNIILKSFKKSTCKSPIVKDNKIILYNYNNINYEVVTDAFYMVFAHENYFNYLGIEKEKNQHKADTIKSLYKTESEIEAMPIKFTFIINEVLNEFNFVDFVSIKNKENQAILLNKDNFINFIVASGLNPYKQITIYGSDVTKPFYYYDSEVIALILPCRY